MEELHSLLHSLSRAQLRLIRNYLSCFSSRGETEAKTLRLVELLLEDVSHIPSLDECSRLVYQTPPDTKILKLKSRLKAKVFDALLLDINIDRKGLFGKSELMPLKLRKKLAQFSYLYYKHGNKPIVKQLLDEIISYSKQYEFYHGVIEGLKYKKYYKGFRIGEKEFTELNTELRYYQYCHDATVKAMDYYYLMIMKTNFQGNRDNKKMQSFLRESISDLKKDYEYTNSSNVGYYLKFLEQVYFENSNDFSAAREACIEQLAITNNNIAVYRKQRIGIIYDNIAQFDLLLGDYDRAFNNAVAAQKHLIKKSANYFVSKEIEFEALFYSGQYQKAKTVSGTLINAIASQTGDFRYSIYRYLRANALFMLNEPKESLKLLSEKQVLSKDKVGWEVGIRILTILCHIEMNNFDYTTQLIDGLRRHIDRQSKFAEIKERDKLITKVLQHMSKRGFAHGQISVKEISILKQLASGDKKCKWKALTPELIPFHEWVVKKYKIDLNTPTAAKKASKRKFSLN